MSALQRYISPGFLFNNLYKQNNDILPNVEDGMRRSYH